MYRDVLLYYLYAVRGDTCVFGPRMLADLVVIRSRGNNRTQRARPGRDAIYEIAGSLFPRPKQ